MGGAGRQTFVRRPAPFSQRRLVDSLGEDAFVRSCVRRAWTCATWAPAAAR